MGQAYNPNETRYSRVDGKHVKVSEATSTFGSGPVIEKTWKPNKVGQEEILRVPDSVFEALGGGAAGGGKTDIGFMIPPLRQFTEHPKFKALIMRRTLTDLEKEIIPRQMEWYAPMGAIYNETKKFWKWPSGARIQNGHAEREDDVRKYDSAEYNYIDWDESTHFTKFQYLYLSLSRCRSSSPDLPAFIRAFTNPGNVGHVFFKERFVTPAPNGRQILKDRITGQKRIYIPFKGTDNPFLLINDPTYLTRLEGLPEQERKAKLLGSWDAYEGQVFSEFRILHLVSEPDNALHVIKPFPIPDWWPKILAIDWGYQAMTFAIWSAIAPSGRCYIYRTEKFEKTTTAIWSSEVVRLTGNEEISDFLLCHSAGQHRGEEFTIQEQVSKAFEDKYSIRLADRDRIGGKNMVHEYLRWEPRPIIDNNRVKYDPEIAMHFLRQSEDKYNAYMAVFVPQLAEVNLPKLQILSHTPEGKENRELVDVIPACVPAKVNPEDVEEFPGDDPYDTLRMIVKTAHNYISTSSEEAKRRERYQEIIDELNNTNNQTSFYRRMEQLEVEDSKTQSVRSHRRLRNR